jgi:hypothetical protein
MNTFQQLRAVFIETISLFRRDPLRMLAVVASQLVGDRETAQHHLAKIKGKD